AGQMLVALDFYLGPVQQFAVIGDPAEAPTRHALQLLQKPFRPNKVVALEFPGGKDEGAGGLELLRGKSARGPVTTYICQDFTCREPIAGPEGRATALEG